MGDPAFATTGATIPGTSNIGQGATIPTDLGLGSLSIGNRVFLDTDGDGIFTKYVDTTIGDVLVSLYRDVNGDGIADGSAIATSTTCGCGLYGFTGLAAGDYIVVIGQANLDSGALAGLYSLAGAGDANDGVEGDDNGMAGALGIQSGTVHLTQDMTGNGTWSVDFGFSDVPQEAVTATPATALSNDDECIPSPDDGIFCGDDPGGFFLAQQLNLTEDEPRVLTPDHFALAFIPTGPGWTIQVTNTGGPGALYVDGVRHDGPILVSDIYAGRVTYLLHPNENSDGRGSMLYDFYDAGGTYVRSFYTDITKSVAVNDAPVGQDHTATTLEDTAYTFKLADFPITDIEGNAFTGVYLTTVPGHGSLLLDTDGNPATAAHVLVAGDYVSRSDIAAGRVTYAPDSDGNGTGYASFTFQVRDDGGTAYGGQEVDQTPRTFTIDVTPVNDAPSAITYGQSWLYDAPANIDHLVTTLSATDDDVSGFTYTLLTDDDRFYISGDELRQVAHTLTDYETEPTVNLQVRVTDPHGATYDQNLAIGVHDMYDPASFEFVVYENSFENQLIFPGTDQFASGGHNWMAFPGLSEMYLGYIPVGDLIVDSITTSEGRTYYDVRFSPFKNQAYTDRFTYFVYDFSGPLPPDLGPEGFIPYVEGEIQLVVRATPSAVTATEDTPFVFSTANENPIFITGQQRMTYSLSVSHGTLSLGSAIGISFVTGDGADDATMTIQGSVGYINAALQGLRYQPDPNYSGADTLSISNIAENGTFTETIAIQVAAVNDAPSATELSGSRSYIEDTPLALGIVVNDPDSGDTITATLTLSDAAAGALSTGSFGAATATYDAATGIWTVSGSVADVNAALAALTFNPAANFNGDLSIATAVSDGVAPAVTGAITLTGLPANDAPTGNDASRTVLEDTPYTFLPQDFALIDLEGNTLTEVKIASLPTAGALTLGGMAVSAGQSISAADIAAGLLVFTPGANANGDGYAEFTFQVRDDGGTSNGGVDLDPTPRHFGFDVTAVNDAPTQNVNAGATVDEGAAVTISDALLGFTDADQPNSAIRFTLTSAVAHGALLLSGAEIGPNGSFTQDDLDNGRLTYVHDGSETTSDAFVFSVSDGAGGSATGLSFQFTVTPVDDPGTPQDDTATVAENTVVALDVRANDSDGDSDVARIDAINGVRLVPGGSTLLASGAKVTLNLDGSLTYDPNHKFDTLVSAATAAATGASNSSAYDSFTYTLADGAQGTARVTVTGVSSTSDHLAGGSGNDHVSGTGGSDLLDLSQGGHDTASGGGGDDGFYFGGAFDSQDQVDGGSGNNQLGLQGDYSGGLVFGAHALDNVQMLVAMSGSDTRFGDLAGHSYHYDLTTVDANVGAGKQLTVNFNTLTASESMTFDGSAETDGSFLTYGGLGEDHLTGGKQTDGFFFGEGRWGANDQVDGFEGALDQLGLQGDYAGANAVVFGVGQLRNIDMIVAVSASDTRFGAGGTAFSYDLTMNDDNVAAGQVLTMSANRLGAAETLTFDGSAETDGMFRVYSGAGNDTILGGARADILWGGAGDDLMIGGGGADELHGATGSDIFAYISTLDSTVPARDHIFDFAAGDRISLAAIDADSSTPDPDSFDFIGSAAFSHNAGELRVYRQDGHWYVDGDIDGNGQADLSIMVDAGAQYAWSESDFILSHGLHLG